MTFVVVLAPALCPDAHGESIASRWSAQQRTDEQCDLKPSLDVWATPEPATRGFPDESGSGGQWTMNDARRSAAADRQRR